MKKRKRTDVTQHGRSQSDMNIDLEIKEAISYLLEMRKMPQTLRAPDDPSHLSDGHFINPDRIQNLLNKISRSLKAIDTATAKLETDFVYGRIDPYGEAHSYIRKVRGISLTALGPLSDAQHIFQAKKPYIRAYIRSQKRLHNTQVPAKQKGIRADYEQHSAVRLADSIIGVTAPRRVREVALRIMTGAKIEPPSDRAITQWLAALRKKQNGK